jgi:hypothetical protein
MFCHIVASNDDEASKYPIIITAGSPRLIKQHVDGKSMLLFFIVQANYSLRVLFSRHIPSVRWRINRNSFIILLLHFGDAAIFHPASAPKWMALMCGRQAEAALLNT